MQVLNNISFYCHSSTAKSIDSIHTQKPWKPSLTTFPTDRLDVDGTRTQFLLKVKVNSLSRVQLFVTLWTVAHQAALSMGFSRQEYCNGLPYPPPGDLPNPRMEPTSINVTCIGSGFLPLAPPGKPRVLTIYIIWVNIMQANKILGASLLDPW